MVYKYTNIHFQILYSDHIIEYFNLTLTFQLVLLCQIFQTLPRTLQCSSVPLIQCQLAAWWNWLAPAEEALLLFTLSGSWPVMTDWSWSVLTHRFMASMWATVIEADCFVDVQIFSFRWIKSSIMQKITMLLCYSWSTVRTRWSCSYNEDPENHNPHQYVGHP